MIEPKKCRPDQDSKLVAAAIERKRQLEEQRKARIFNPRLRKIGVDVEFLDKQVEEKRRERELEKERESRLNEALVRSSQLAILLERQQQQERRKLNKEVDAFRHAQQRDSRQQCLQRSEKPTEPGLSSAQRFEGEDVEGESRAREQREQMQSWIVQQVQERRQAERERREAESAYQQALLNRDKRALALERMEADCRRRLNAANASFNRALAGQQSQRNKWQAAQDEEDARAEIYNHVTGDFLTEAPEQADSLRGPDKPLAGRYKGMSPAELKLIRDAQHQQIINIQRMRADEERKNQEWNRLMNGNARAAESYQRELERKKIELNKQIAEENLHLAEQQKLHQDYLKRHVYSSKPSSEFYAQFNKSTR